MPPPAANVIPCVSTGICLWDDLQVDGSWALAFLNAGTNAATVTRDTACLQQTGWEVDQVLAVRDLWAHQDLGDIIVGASNLTATLPADGGAALYRLTPVFNATIPV